MGKFLTTVFGGNGIVSNLVDIVKVPELIKKKKAEIEQVETLLARLHTVHDSIKEDEARLAKKQEDINTVRHTIKLNKNLLKQLLESDSKNTQLIQQTAQTLHFNQNKVYTLISAIATQRNEYGEKKNMYHNTKTDLDKRHLDLQTELENLENKIERKRGQLNNNLKAI